MSDTLTRDRAGVVDLGQFKHERIKVAAEAVRSRAFADKAPLAVIDRHVRKLAQSANRARLVGIDTLADARRVQILALNDVRREILGRPH